MTHRSPLLTLAAMAIFFAALLTADFIVHPSAESASAPAAPASPSALPTPAAPASPAAATPTPTPAAASSPTTAGAVDDDPFPAKAVYVGRAENRNLAIAIAVLGDQAAAYLCDGRNREAWLRGTVDGDTLRLTSRSGYRITAQLDDDGRLDGEVRGDGRRWQFEIRRADPPAGLYRAEGSRTTIGWIRLSDGSLVGVATDADGTSAPAPELGPDQQAEVDGETLHAAPVDGDADI